MGEHEHKRQCNKNDTNEQLEVTIKPISRMNIIDTSNIGDLQMPKTFETTRIWLNAIPNQSFQAIDKDVLCHWDSGSNSNIF